MLCRKGCRWGCWRGLTASDAVLRTASEQSDTGRKPGSTQLSDSILADTAFSTTVPAAFVTTLVENNACVKVSRLQLLRFALAHPAARVRPIPSPGSVDDLHGNGCGGTPAHSLSRRPHSGPPRNGQR